MTHVLLITLIVVIIIVSCLFVSKEMFSNLKSNCNCLIPGLYLGKSNIGGKYGRGIFASKQFNVDEIVETAPYIEDKLMHFIGVSRDYVFNTGNNNAALCFGYASLYNHSDDPNCKWYFEDNQIVIKCIKPIKKGDEVLISYGQSYWNTRNLEKK
jgi:hypothetical protein